MQSARKLTPQQMYECRIVREVEGEEREHKRGEYVKVNKPGQGENQKKSKKKKC